MIITKDHVGRKVRLANWDQGLFLVVTAVGRTRFLGERSFCGEETWRLDLDWQIVEEPKPVVLPSKAIIEAAIRMNVEYQTAIINQILNFIDEHAEVFK